MPEPGKDGDDGKATTLLLLGRRLDGDVQVQRGTGPGDCPLRSTGHLTPVGTPALLGRPGPGGLRGGLAPDATPWLWRPRSTSTA